MSLESLANRAVLSRFYGAVALSRRHVRWAHTTVPSCAPCYPCRDAHRIHEKASFRRQTEGGVGVCVCISGGGGIRTPGTREGTPVFETGAFNQAPPPHRGVADVLYLSSCPTFRPPGSNYGERQPFICCATLLRHHKVIVFSDKRFILQHGCDGVIYMLADL